MHPPHCRPCNCLGRRRRSLTALHALSVEDVGDQSDYVGALLVEMAGLMPVLRSYLAAVHFRFVCDRLVVGFVHRYVGGLLRCKQISPMANQQMLLDCHAIRAVLHELHG